MEYFGNNDYRDYLAHSGVKGMRWKKHKYTGIVNGSYVYDIAGGNSRTRSIAKRAGEIKNPSKAYIDQVNRLQRSLIDARNSDSSSDQAKTDKKTKADKKADKASKYTNKMLEKTANDVIMGKYGAGDDRKKQLEKKGLSYSVVQNKVNELLGVSKRHSVSKADLKKVENFFSKSKNKKVADIANVKAVFSEGKKKKTSKSGKLKREAKKKNKLATSSFMTL